MLFRSYNAGGTLGLNQPNEFFADKTVEVSRLRQYELVVSEKLDLTDEIARTSMADIDLVQLIRDDNDKYVLYVKPAESEAFTVYPEASDVKLLTRSVLTPDFDAFAVRESLGRKYYSLVQRHPDLKVNVLMPEVGDADVSHISRVDICKDKYDSNKAKVFVYIDNIPQQEAEIDKRVAQRLWLVDDKEMFKLSLTAQLFNEKLSQYIGGQSEDGHVQFRDDDEKQGIDNSEASPSPSKEVAENEEGQHPTVHR